MTTDETEPKTPTEEEMLARLEHLVREVRRLQIKTWVIYVLVTAVLVLAGFAVWGGYKDRQTAEKAQDAIIAAQLALDQRQLGTCQSSNSARQAVRVQFIETYTVIGDLFPDSDGVQTAVESLIDSVPTPQEQDQDCNENGGLDTGDYSDP